jgi:hypothetical protein
MPGLFSSGLASAQCGVGYTQAQANWDKLDYYFNSGSNIAPYGFSTGNYVSNAQEQTQKFGIGPNYFTIVTSASGIVKGTNSTHTGDLTVAGIAYTGDDAMFTPTANLQTITITFNTEVKNATFTLYDLDGGMNFLFGAQNALLVAQNINVVFQAPTNLSIGGTGNNSAAPTVSSSGSTIANTINDGSATITVGGPVKKITITMTTIGSDPTFWLSDISACVTSTFPTNYQQSFNNQPWQGNVQNQADYFIVTPDNNYAYQVDPATGKCWMLFQDPAKTFMNSFAYDPGNHWLYYISENSALNSANKALKKYDFSTNTISTILADITTLGIPTFNSGVESAGAAYYNGQLFIGLEGGQFSGTVTRKSLIFRMDLDGAGVPNNAVQVYATPCYNGGTFIHDWADFTIKDGVLYNYNSAKNGSGATQYQQNSYTTYDMMTGQFTTYMNPTPANQYAGQAGINWSGTMYSIYSVVQPYNGNGTLGASQPITVVSGPAWVGNAGDASDPFRPKCDFGDAPATYDPVANKPAVHERMDSVRLGVTWDNEWLKRGTTSVEDVDDGIAFVPILTPGGHYFPQCKVYNNSGQPATLLAWLDFNNNGVFDASEAINPITVPSSSSYQLWYLFWPAVSTPLVPGQFTYMRVRITTGAMTANDATGFFFNGEVEDYKVTVDNYPLAIRNISFDAHAVNNSSVKLGWSATEDANYGGYEIERSSNSATWQHVGLVSGDGVAGVHNYEYSDQNPLKGVSYYRLRYSGMAGAGQFSPVRSVKITTLADLVTVTPNPASGTNTNLRIDAVISGKMDVRLINMSGKTVFQNSYAVNAGINNIPLSLQSYSTGTYVVQVTTADGDAVNIKLIIK